MAEMNIFENDAFSMMTMLAAYEKVDFKPSFLGDLNVFTPKPITGDTVYIEERNGALNLVPSTPRGSPLPQRKTEQRTAKSFQTTRIAQGDRLTASEIAKVRAFGQTSELVAMQQEVARRMSGPLGIQANIELTWEHMRLGAIQGIVLDADGSVLWNWYDAFSITQPDIIYFDLAGALKASSDVHGALVLRRYITSNIVRPMQRASKGMFTPQSRIYAACGDDIFDAITSHGDVARAYDIWGTKQDATDSNSFQVFPWGGVFWCNYRGTDDNSTVSVATDEAKFFPVNAPGVFVNAWGSGESFGQVNAPGQALMPLIVPDRDRDQFVDLELYSYPLMYCSRPEMLLRGKLGAAPGG
jgi:hypothetical protein